MLNATRFPRYGCQYIVEVLLFQITMADDQRHDIAELYTKMTLGQMKEQLPNFDWQLFFNEVFRDITNKVHTTYIHIVWQKEYVVLVLISVFFLLSSLLSGFCRISGIMYNLFWIIRGLSSTESYARSLSKLKLLLPTVLENSKFYCFQKPPEWHFSSWANF